MTVNITAGKASGTVTAPPSKSVAHRALICGALTEKSVIKNIAMSKDIEATLSCLKNLGASAEFVNNTDLEIGGLNPFNISIDAVLDCFESGSTLRFMIPICLLSGKRVTLCGSSRLFERPLTVYEEIAKQKGFLFQKAESSLTLCGKLTAGNYKVAGNISSQFITGLMFALSLLEGTSTIEIINRLESASYLDITRGVMADFGAQVASINNTFTVGGGEYKSREYTVEGDCSNAAFLDAFNLVGGSVEVLGVPQNTLQGDRVYKDFFALLKEGKKEFDLTDCPDLGPVMFAAAAALGGAKFIGTKRLRIKESDRVAAMAEELSKFGIKMLIEDNSAEILAGQLCTPKEPLSSHNDHRIVMSLAFLCSITGGSIEGAEAVAKSFPDYFNKIKSLGIGIKENETR